MCFKIKPPATPPVQQAPTKEDQTAVVDDERRRRAATQQSTYGNIFTSVLGDSGYGKNVKPQTASPVAAIGA